MLWEAVFMLIVLKIPVVYLCAVVWWAIKAEPRPLEGAGTLAALGPAPECDWRTRRGTIGRGPLPRHSGRLGRPTRLADARVRISS